MIVCASSSRAWPKETFVYFRFANPAEILVDLNSVEKDALTVMEQESHEDVETCKNRIMGNLGFV